MAAWTLLAGPSRPARVLGIEAGAVFLQIDPLAATDARDGRDHPGAVVALLEPDAVQWPIGIVLPPAGADLMPVSVAGTPVGRGEISIGWGAITLAEVRWPVLRWWNPGIPALALPARSIAAGPEVRPEPAAHPPELAGGLAALAAGDHEVAVRQLIGVGDGLIRPGDSVLSGALAALAAWAPESGARQSLAQAVAAGFGQTTPASAALLQSAVSGFAVPELIQYLTALTAGGPEADATLEALTALGADSGAAMALGASCQRRALGRGGARTQAENPS